MLRAAQWILLCLLGLGVLAAPAQAAPANDNFANATSISGASGSVSGTNVGATAESGEPAHYIAATNSVWYKWTAPNNSGVYISSSASGTALAMYTGTAVNALTRVYSLPYPTTQIQIATTSGTTYYLAVDINSVGGTPGTFTLTWSAPSVDGSFPSPTISATTSASTGPTITTGMSGYSSDFKEVWPQYRLASGNLSSYKFVYTAGGPNPDGFVGTASDTIQFLQPGTAYTVRWVGALTTAYTYDTVSPEVSVTTPGTPIAAPTFSAIRATSISGTLPSLPTSATSWSVQVYGTGLTQVTGLGSGATYTVSGLTPVTAYTVYYAAVYTNGNVLSPGTAITTGPVQPSFDQITNTGLRATAPTLNGTSWSLDRATSAVTFSSPSTTGLALWLKADAITGVTSATPLASWTDSSGSGMTATQTNTGAQPLYVANAANGYAAVRFSGNGTFLQLPAGFSTFSSGTTAFVVTRPAAGNTANAALFDLGNGGTGSDDLSLFCGGTGTDLDYLVNVANSPSYATSAGALTNGQWQLAEVAQATDGSTQLYLNGNSLIPNTLPTLGLPRTIQRSNNAVGAFGFQVNEGPGGFFTGDIAEILIYNTALTSSQRTAVEAYLTAKYSLTTAVTPSSLSFSSIATGQATGSQYTDSSRSANQLNWYRYSNGGTTGLAASVITAPGAPAAPTGFTNVTSSLMTVGAPALPTGAESLTLQWEAPGDSSYGHNIPNIAGGTGVNVSGLLASTTYPFRFLAVGANGSTPGTAASHATSALPVEAPGAPTFLATFTSTQSNASTVTVEAPELPSGFVSMTLQVKATQSSDASFATAVDGNSNPATGLGANAVWVVASAAGVGILMPQFSYDFRYVGVTSGGTQIPGAVGTIVTPGYTLQPPGQASFSNLTSAGVTITAPNLPVGANSLALQMRPDTGTTYTTVATGVAAGAVLNETYPIPATGNNYFYRFLAVSGTNSNLALDSTTPGLELAPTTIASAPAISSGTITSSGATFLAIAPASTANWTISSLTNQAATSFALQAKVSANPDSTYVTIWTSSTLPSATEVITSMAANTGYSVQWVVSGPAGTAISPVTTLTTLTGTRPGVAGPPTFPVAGIGPSQVQVALPSQSLATLGASYLQLYQVNGYGAPILVANNVTSSTPPTIATGLVPSTPASPPSPYVASTYSFYWVAVSSGGASTNGLPASVTTTTTNAEVPAAPIIGTITGTSIGVQLPAIVSPLETSGLTLQYQLTQSLPAAGWITENSTPAPGGTAYTISSLTAGRSYSFQVVASPTSGGSTETGPTITASTTAAAPGTPGAPVSVTVINTNTVNIVAPSSLPANADYLQLQEEVTNLGTPAYYVVANFLAPSQTTTVNDLSPGMTYSFRYAAVGQGGTTAGAAYSPTTVMPSASVAWLATGMVGSPIQYVVPLSESSPPNGYYWTGIRQPQTNTTVLHGTNLIVNAYTAFDWDEQDTTTGTAVAKRQVSDVILYYWKVTDSGNNNIGTFTYGNSGQSSIWTAPATAGGPYTLSLVVVDQGGLNVGNGETGPRADTSLGSWTSTTLFTRTITVN